MSLLTVALLSLAATTIRADQFTYSFAWDTNGKDVLQGYVYPGHSVSGSFTGTLNGNYVDNISNISLTLDNTTWPTWTNLSADRFAAAGLPPIVSFDSALCDFGFYLPSPGDAWFYIAPSRSSAGAGGDWPIEEFAVGRIVNGTWTLTDVSNSNPVPDIASTITLLGCAMAGLACMGRRLSSR